MSTRGFRWIGASAPGGAMYVEWEKPEGLGSATPIVLVHGGGGQGTDWLATPDGRPGWAPLLVELGWPVYVVDRPGYGRAAGGAGADRTPAPPRETTAGIFASGADPRHTQWPGPGGPDDPAVVQLTASSAGIALDQAAAQRHDGEQLVRLLEDIGPAVVVTHSLGAPAGWLAAANRPDLVRAVVAIEPPGPPFLDAPQIGLSLGWGLTSAPLPYDPPVDSPQELTAASTLPGLKYLPVAVVEAEASPLGGGARAVAEYLREVGAHADHLRLVDHEVRGNGHGMVLELNHHEVLDVVLTWLGSLDLPS
ncbi:alpha/beta fold hydrolase [Streptomyces sp. NPDC048288]|uniref:alpha/beta fold hydrolase n=1 Tax=Streptomyces sp. NPDC048288 TaxID=3365529 RepID=UPI003715723C